MHLYNMNIIFFCDSHYFKHVRRCSPPVNRNDCLSFFCNYVFNFIYINLISFITINKNYFCSTCLNSACCCIKRITKTVITSSPLLIPKDFNDKIKASVPLFVEIQCFTPTYFENFFSNFSMNGPNVNSEVSISLLHSAKYFFIFKLII